VRTNDEENGLAATRKSGGHGDHWSCIFSEVQSDALLALIRKSIGEDAEPEVVRTREGTVTVYRSHGDAIQTCVLVVRQQAVSAYPEIVRGSVWPIKVREIVPWANGVEGQITGSCRGTEVSLFDTRFYANWGKYAVGETYHFQVGALAYSVGSAGDMEIETELEEGSGSTKVSMSGARAYMPASLAGGEADIDDFWFYSPLEEPSRETHFADATLHTYMITMALPDEFEMRVPLHAATHIISPEMSTVKVEDDLIGYLWLQGHLVE